MHLNSKCFRPVPFQIMMGTKAKEETADAEALILLSAASGSVECPEDNKWKSHQDGRHCGQWEQFQKQWIVLKMEIYLCGVLNRGRGHPRLAKPAEK